MGTKECGYRRPHLLLPSSQVGGPVPPLPRQSPPPPPPACLPSPWPPWSPGCSLCLPLAPPPPEHTPGLCYKSHLTAGLEELLAKKSLRIIQPGKPPSSAEPRPLPPPHPDTTVGGVGRARGRRSGWGWLKHQVHCVPVCFFKNRLLFGAVLGLQQN